MLVNLNVNGTTRTIEVDTRVTLLDALREHLALTGAKRAATRGNVAPAPCWSTDSVYCPA
jgi:xanthine dehydrogenase YagT iron-sulfur-binding subunit